VAGFSYDTVIIGGGIVGLALARRLLAAQPGMRIAIIEKEPQVAQHASGRNSGVLHAGFYYTADSLKAKFCREGNRMMREYCTENRLALDACGKVVVAKNEAELAALHELYARGQKNGVEVRLVDAQQLEDIEPHASTHQWALHVPSTASVSPTEVCQHMAKELAARGVIFHFNCAYQGREGKGAIRTTAGVMQYGRLWNCAGLYADRIAHEFGVGEDYTILPFKGLYLMAPGEAAPLRTHIYPVPNLANPFLGVHFTKTVNGMVKIGPTATPAFWREQYDFRHGFNGKEMASILALEAKLFVGNHFKFRDLAFEEMRKYSKNYIRAQAAYMVRDYALSPFNAWSRPGIRAQLLNRRTMKLEQDFLVEQAEDSVHVLNAISPAFTCSMPFAEWLVEKFQPVSKSVAA
jgi:L-2-hydroxyglutarate oxidase LhgO